MILFWLAAAFALGILTGFFVAIPAWILFILAAAALVLAAVFWRRHPERFASLVLLCFLLGGARAELAYVHIGPHDVAFFNGQTVTLIGYVNTEPDNRDTGNNYVLTVQDLVRGGRNLPMTGQVEVHTAAGELFNEGDQLQLTGYLATPTDSPAVPYRTILANRGIYSEMSFPRGFTVGHVSLGLVGFADTIRAEIQNTIKTTLPEPEATFLIALLIGARSAQLGTLAPVLIRTGLIHLIAISGIKVAIVAGTVNEFLRLVASRTPRLILSSSILLAYWLVSGATVAGLRASIMWLLIFIAAWLGRPTFGLVSLGLAAGIMLLVNPTLLFDPGFQLTVFATASMAVFTPALSRFLRWMPAAFRASLTTTTAAQLGVLPIQISSFHIANPVSLLANGLVLPFVPFTMVVGFAMVLLPGRFLSNIAYGLVHVMILVANWAATIPAPLFSNSWPVAVVLAYFAVLAVLALLAWRLATFQYVGPRGEWLVGVAVAAVGLSTSFGQPSVRDVVSFPVSGSMLISWHGSSILVDGGAKPSTLLTALGQDLPYPDDTLDAVVDTSPNARNVAALMGVISDLRVSEVVDPGVEYPSSTYGRWRESLAARHIAIYALRRGLTLRIGALRIRCLAPDALYPNTKDGAGILAISVGRSRLIYVGDASAAEQQDLAFTGQDLQASTVISSTPIEPVLARAVHYRSLVAPSRGQTVPLSP